ncbi:MAG: MFS transporter [Rhodobacterales bacterium]
MSRFWSLSAAGFAATAIGFGPGRMGFGLFVPEFRTAFSMSTTAVGLVSSLGFLGFFIGLMIAQALLDRRGPRVPVLAGLAAATVGMGTVALAPSLPVLAGGVFVAASSAGLAWSPFNNAIHRLVREDDRPAALSMVSTGTGIGVALAGLAAFAMVIEGISWRYCWAFFAGASAAALAGNWLAFRGVGADGSGSQTKGWGELAQVATRPLVLVGFTYGTVSAIYISFAADHMVTAGGVSGLDVQATPALVFICYGLLGLTGLLAGRLRNMLGLPLLLRLLMLAGALSLALVAIMPGTWGGLILSAGLQGVHVMMTSAVLAFWSERLFPTLPSRSFTVALLAAALGSVLGPAVAGIVSDAFGATVMFGGAALLPLVTAVTLQSAHVRDAPAQKELRESA